MDFELVPIMSRWLHLLFVVAAIGGAFFLRFILIPSAESVLDIEQHRQLREAIRLRWARIVHLAIAVILLSGFYNVYYGIIVLKKVTAYHMLFGLKFLLASGIFFIASALVGKSPAFESMRSESKKWLGVLLAVALLIILISGVMKNLPSKSPTSPNESQTALVPLDWVGG